MDIFRQKIQSAIKDTSLQAALDKNAQQRLVARERAYDDLPISFQELKRQAHKIRLDTISNLDEYLSEFIRNANRNGFIIHRAGDAKEARDLILDIVDKYQPKLISKSKTMMSEEINLNPALEAEGIEVVETDLGEYIVQLRGEHPSHIITPAVHLRREDVGSTFHEKLGIPFTDDIQTLTNTARARLRQTFLNSDIGISGVNMGVINTGTLCVVTNEGNGRMVTTLPKVHIALMGIERLVPDMESLSLILRLLPRSATGQKMTVYTQLISGPRRPDEVDGADERHLILIDNGRTNIKDSIFAESLCCIRCGACINVCPVFREIGGFAYTSNRGDYTPYPGPIGSILSPILFGQAEFGHLAQASTLCGACKEACPIDIDIPTMLLRIRSAHKNISGESKINYTPVGMPSLISGGLKLFTWISTQPTIFKTAQKLISILGRIWAPKSSWMYLPAFTGWGFSKDFPRPSQKTFQQQWDTIHQIPGIGKSTENNINPVETISNESTALDSKKSGALISRFETELKALSGDFTRCSVEDLGDKVHALIQSKGFNELLCWEKDKFPTGLLEKLQKKGVIIAHNPNPEIRAGLTGANAAIAETGTIVLTSTAGQPLTTSLLPEFHIAILNETDIFENLPQVLKLREVQDASSAVLISGPSRTADIEMTLTIGVHGPSEIHVFCVNDL